MRSNVAHRLHALAYAVVAIITLAVVGERCGADTLVLNNGRQYEGRLIAQDDRLVTFEIRRIGVNMTLRFQAAQVKQVISEVQDGPTYCVLSIVGTIGRDLEADSFVTADSFIQVLDEVRAIKPDYVILEIDSPGGSISEMDRIIAAITDARELKFIAYIKDAHSAAAVIALTCPTIFMDPNSSIGAAVPFSLGPDGTPQNIQEKWFSAIRAGFRNVARVGGHSPLLLRGMSETEIELAVVEQSGQLVIIEPAHDHTGRILKPKGQILTLTADEALACGLSEATVESNDAIRQHLGLASWHPTLTNARDYIINKSRREKRRVVIAREQAERARVEAERRAAIETALKQKQDARQAHIDRISPTLSHIEIRLAELDAQGHAAIQAEYELDAWQRDQLASLRTEYYQLLDLANLSRYSFGEIRLIEIEYQRQQSLISEDYQRRASEARERRNRAVMEADQLRRQHEELVRSVPQ